jgi:hypothetical protein
MSSVTSAPPAKTRLARRPLPKGEIVHRVLLTIAALIAGALIASVAIYGHSYYAMSIEDRPLSPLHAPLRSSGSIGLKLGFLSMGMFVLLVLYPIRKRVKWLGRIGSTRRWLNFHVLLGLSTPIVVTFHTTFKWAGLAGVAYWTMIAVAASGIVGRYVYSKIPRSINANKLSAGELESQMTALTARLEESSLFSRKDLAPLLNVPSFEAVREMNLMKALFLLICTDLARPIYVSRLRRQRLSRSQKISTVFGLRHSANRDVEAMLETLKKQSRLSASTAFLDRTERIFHLWHVIHRPFSLSFIILIAVHIGVAISVGF